MSTPSTQILVSKYYFTIQVTEVLGEEVEAKSFLEKIQVESRALCVGRKERRLQKQQNSRSTGQRSQP